MQKNRKKTNIQLSRIYQLLIGIALIITINIISNFVYFRLDLTKEKRYTLSKPTKKLLKELDDIVYFKVYLEGDFPSGFKRLSNETKEMLNQFKAYSDNVKFEFIDPTAYEGVKQTEAVYRQLVESGLNPTSLQVKEKTGMSRKLIFPGAIATYRSKETPVQLLVNQAGRSPEYALNASVEALEFNLATAIRKLTGEKKFEVAFIHGHGELPEMQVEGAKNATSEFYNITHVELNGQLSVLTKRQPYGEDSSKYFMKNIYDAIIIAKPTTMFDKNERDKFIIDQYIMKGGKVLWLVDGVSASMDSLQEKPETIGLSNNINLDDMLFNYGARINHNLVTDLESLPIPVVVDQSGTQKFIPWIFMPLLVPTSTHPIVRNLNAIKTEFISTIDTVDVPGIRKTVLLTTGQYSKKLNSPVIIKLDYLYNAPQKELYNQPFQPVAVLLEGEFSSLFHGRLPEEVEMAPEIGFTERSEPNKMIIVADGDIIKNQIQYSVAGVPTSLPLGYDRYTGQQFGNREFIQNALDYLCDESGLLELRSRKVELRMLDAQKIKEKTKWQIINIGIPLAFIILFGIFYNFYRKKRYSVVR